MSEKALPFLSAIIKTNFKDQACTQKHSVQKHILDSFAKNNTVLFYIKPRYQHMPTFNGIACISALFQKLYGFFSSFFYL